MCWQVNERIWNPLMQNCLKNSDNKLNENISHSSVIFIHQYKSIARVRKPKWAASERYSVANLVGKCFCTLIENCFQTILNEMNVNIDDQHSVATEAFSKYPFKFGSGLLFVNEMNFVCGWQLIVSCGLLFRQQLVEVDGIPRQMGFFHSVRWRGSRGGSNDRWYPFHTY